MFLHNQRLARLFCSLLWTISNGVRRLTPIKSSLHAQMMVVMHAKCGAYFACKCHGLLSSGCIKSILLWLISRAGHGCTCRLPGPVPTGIFISKLIPAPVKDFSHRLPGSVGQKPAGHGYHTGNFVKTIKIHWWVHTLIFGGEGDGGGGGEQLRAHVHSFSRAEHR